MPVRRSSTSLRKLLLGSSYRSRLPVKPSSSNRYAFSTSTAVSDFRDVLQAAAGHQPLARGGAHGVELLEIRRGIERRAFELGDHQRRRRQVAIGARRQPREFAE